MRTIIKGRWFILLIWIALIVSLLFTAPNMEELVREKGQISVPDGYSSSIADEILGDSDNDFSLSIALVFHNPEGITVTDEQEIEKAIDSIEANKGELGITDFISHMNQPELSEELISKDNKTIISSLAVDLNGREVSDVRDDLLSEIDHIAVEHYLTGAEFIDEDVIISSQEGLRKTEIITVAFILIILFLVFRSLVAPIIPLVTVGITYLVSQSIVAFLVDGVDFPLSNFTQIFLVAILFGIGTDYCILLLSRFKEEMSKNGEDVTSAIITTYKTAGKTVFFSALAVLIGFSSIGLSTFELYQSASAVAIGIVVLILALLTIVPFFMAVLGKKLFWPVKGKLEHKQSKLWEAIGKFSLSRPMIAMLLILVVVVPLYAFYDQDLSYNSLDEIGDSYDSVKGFNIVSKSFGPGETMPSKIVIEHHEALDNSESLSLIENISREVAKHENVEKVRSATRPLGELIPDFYITTQLESVNEGLEASSDGLNDIQFGLTQIIEQLPAMEAGLSQVAVGPDGVNPAFEQIVTQLNILQEGLNASAGGITQISEGMTLTQEYVAKLSDMKTEDSGFFIPQEVIDQTEFQQVLDTYLKNDRTTAVIEVILKDNPYSVNSLDSIEEIEMIVSSTIKGTSFEKDRFGVSGVTGIYKDLKEISDEDYNRTMFIMLIGISLILIILLRSIVMPIYLVVSLIICYFTSMAFTEVIFVDMLGYPGLSWAIPFFGFVMLMALGVDYSIFLMDRFNEYKEKPAAEAILLAMKNMGTVIISAVIILAGTFAAMYPSGVLSLTQIATVVVTGLILYAVLFLPFFVPVMVKLFGKANWWPFKKMN
ncbi:MMPL family transporter [Chengkuizengella axinellae]|uniref:MMPL family transporter n=1 Tax=Chengkuizengella axinellae TaxID=3064388 RepID=A0ABT9IYL6_9BACL|nr:MMPL family transporter [Chengkuizengella sp. 2205SS18-9]MDP5274318.1 MMPL family transporter [Chengkuizengella sp. 2205SS18-9]